MEDKLIPLALAAQLSPADPSPTTLWCWCRKGIKTRSGIIQLKHTRVGGRLYTTAKAVADFHAALADADSEHFAIEGASE